MITYARLSFREQKVGNNVYRRLVELWPGGARANGGFFGREPIDDPRVVAALRLLEESGLKYLDESHPDFQFMLHYERVYSSSDLDAFDFFQLAPDSDAYHTEAWRDENALIVLPHEFQPAQRFAAYCTLPGWHYVPALVRDALHAAGLKGVEFRPAFCESYYNRDQVKMDGLYWELDSKVTLPPVSPTMQIRDHEDRPVPPGETGSKVVRPYEGLHMCPELKYLAKDLAIFETVDLARTVEFFTPYSADPSARPLIASARFRRAVESSGYPTRWLPVHVE